MLKVWKLNSFWNKNIEFFFERFPALAKRFSIENEPDDDYFSFLEILPSKKGIPTAKEDGKLLHSFYDPQREAQGVVNEAKSENIRAVAFFSMGLGYSPLEWAKNFPEDAIIIVEPSARHFFLAFKYTDLTELFKHKKLILLIQAGIEEANSIIENTEGFSHTAIIENTAQSLHAKDYFTALKNLIQRNKKKVELNNSTLEKFSKLWLKNSCKNIKDFSLFEGINIYENLCPKSLDAIIISAGPSLSKVLPHLKELKKRFLLIAVDTALRACLNAGVEPDFILLIDPQYYAFRHIAGLKSPSSVLILESSAYPPAYRFLCRKKVLCSSLLPLGKYFESKLGKKGELGAGGSVSTSAWDFARFIGAKNIYCAGLDLSYPQLETHIKGSLFEEETHKKSTRVNNAETKLCSYLLAANTQTAKDYDGNEVFTDDKMKMFAWWFESQTQKYPEIHSYSLASNSLKIPGFKFCTIDELLKKEEKLDLKKEFFNCEKITDKISQKKELFENTLSSLKNGFKELYNLAQKGIEICEKVLSLKNVTENEQVQAQKELQKIDSKIMNSTFKEVASLVFPTEKKLNEILEKQTFPNDKSGEKTKSAFFQSKIIYELLKKSISEYQKYL